MREPCTIDTFFKKKSVQYDEVIESSSSSNIQSTYIENHLAKNLRVEKENDISFLEHDQGLRLSIWEYSINQHDEIQRAYIKAGSYQPHLSEYPLSSSIKHQRHF